jgi:hypothetical protein
MDTKKPESDSLFDRLPPDLQEEALAYRERQAAKAAEVRQRLRRRRAVTAAFGGIVLLGAGLLLAASWWFLPAMAAAGAAAAFAIEALRLGHLAGMGLYGAAGFVVTAVGMGVEAILVDPLSLFSILLVYFVAGAVLGMRAVREREDDSF